jgi:cytochrome c5
MMKYAVVSLITALTCTMISPVQGEGRDADALFESYCFSWHGTGWEGAPVIGDSTAWADRKAKGMETLLRNTIEGINGMPPKGSCSDCTEAELTSVVELLTVERKRVADDCLRTG